MPDNIEGTFTGFLKSLAELNIDLTIKNTPKSITLTAERFGKKAQVALGVGMILHASSDLATVELGDIINAVL